MGTAPPSILNAAQVRERCGVTAIVLRGHFVGVVAESREAAHGAAALLVIDWTVGGAATSAAPESALVSRRTVARRGDAAAALSEATLRIGRTYAWPEDAECRGIVVAEVRDMAASIWLATGMPARLRGDLAVLLGMPLECIELLAHAFVGATDTLATYHAAADAALLSQSAGRPVQVELSRAATRLADDPPPRLVTTIDGGLDETGVLNAYAMVIEGVSRAPAPLALLLSGARSLPMDENPSAHADELLDAPLLPYDVEHLEVTRVSNPSGFSAADPSVADFAHVFAVESHCDEAAAAMACDPVTWRLQQPIDARGAALIRRTSKHAAWIARPASVSAPTTPGGIRSGRGFAYARSVDGRLGSTERSWAAWVAEVAVDTRNGDVTVTRVVVGHDAEHPALASDRASSARIAAPQRHPQAVEVITRLTTEQRFDAPARIPIASPLIEVLGELEIARSGVPERMAAATFDAAPMPLFGGGAAMLPAAAAIANAIFDATGIRLREPPFSADRVRRALEESRAPRAARERNWLAKALAGIAGVLALIVPWRAPIAPVAPPDPGYFSAAAIERGRLVSAAGDCAVCHTLPNGARYAGGLDIETPFGTIVSTNITPDVATGIGGWSYAAFERALRSGIHRDGTHLYPAFPYTAYAKVTDGDLLALYAYLMSQPAVRATPRRTRLAFPFNVRPLLAAWNLMFHRSGVFTPDPAQSSGWNRGAYLVDGLGHCGGCHSPRNAFGAERGGRDYLAGGSVDGWDAPALNGIATSPVAWTREALYDYLRTGYSATHGAAAGPMAAVVHELGALPDDDLRAIATYLTASNRVVAASATVSSAMRERQSVTLPTLDALGARIYGGACAVCHEPDQGPPTYGIKVALTSISTLHARTPTNLLLVLLQGVSNPPTAQLGYMPGFHDTLDDAQLAHLANYLRARFAPEKPPWRDVGASAAALRSRVPAP